MSEVVCKGCGIEFKPKRSWQVFCDRACKDKFWNKRRMEGAAQLSEPQIITTPTPSPLRKIFGKIKIGS